MAVASQEAIDLQHLKSCLKLAKVNDDVIKWFADEKPAGGLGMCSVDDFVNYFVVANYETQIEKLLDKKEEFKEDGIQLSRVRAAWRTASNAIKEKETKKTTASSAGDWEDPLEAHEIEDLGK